METFAAIAGRGPPVHVVKDTDVRAALAYSNHRSIAPHVDSTLANMFDHLRYGRALNFTRISALHIPILRMSTPAVLCRH